MFCCLATAQPQNKMMLGTLIDSSTAFLMIY